MKILYVITKANYGGAQRYVHELALEMSKHCDVSVATGGRGELVDHLKKDGIRTLSIATLQRNINPFKEIIAFSALVTLFKKENPDIVHLNSSKAGVLGACAARLAGVKKIIFTAHGWPFFEPRNSIWRSIAWLGSYLTALLAHRVILVSHYDYNHTSMPFVRHKLSVIHTAVPPLSFIDRDHARTELFDEETCTKHASDVWLVTIAELNHNKNIKAALGALARLHARSSKKIFYTVIGDGEERDELQRFINAHNLESSVRLYGQLSNARAYLKAFDMFLLPSKKEGLPYTLLEAGSASLPVIASTVGGIPEIIEHEKNGLLIDPNDPSLLARTLETLLEETEVGRVYGERLHEKVITQFSLDAMIQKTRALYDAN